MFGGFRAFADRFFSKAADGYEASHAHPGARGLEARSREALELAAEAERGRLPDGRLPPTVVNAPARRLTPEQERKRIDDMPIP
jgi:hypothetical protein